MKEISIPKSAVDVIREAAIKDIQDMIHDVHGAPQEMLDYLGVNREMMLLAANDLLETMQAKK